MKYVHKSFIVIPIEKEKIIKDRYLSWILGRKFMGVIGVELDGRWKILVQPKTQPDEEIELNQEILKLLIQKPL